MQDAGGSPSGGAGRAGTSGRGAGRALGAGPRRGERPGRGERESGGPGELPPGPLSPPPVPFSRKRRLLEGSGVRTLGGAEGSCGVLRGPRGCWRVLGGVLEGSGGFLRGPGGCGAGGKLWVQSGQPPQLHCDPSTVLLAHGSCSAFISLRT